MEKKIISIIILFILAFFINYSQIEILYPLSKGLLPLIPYLSYFVLGQVLYEIYKKKYFPLKRNTYLINFSLIFLIFNLLILYFHPYKLIPHQVFFPEFLMVASIFVLLNLIIIRWVDIKNRFRMIFTPFENIGKISFTAYYIQMIVVVFPYYYIFKSSPTIANLTILTISILALVLFERIWRKYDYVFGLEWFLRKGTAILMERITSEY